MISGIEYEYRTGIGTDIHRLVPERKLMLGGIVVPFEMGLLAHSDGDVVLHAVIDAMFGAAGMGDIGMHFPDSDEVYKGIPSKNLLIICKEKLADKRWEIVNIDITITAEQPKLGNYKGQMKRNIAGLLAINFENVNIKAKTNEGMGEVGRVEAIEALAVVMLRRRLKRTL